MAQFGRPSTDTTLGSYTDQGGGSTSIFGTIDEVVADDGDFIQSPLAPANAAYVTKLTSVEDPQSSTGHVVRYRYQKNASGGAQIDLTVQLRQGYVNEGTPGTLIAEWTHTNIPSAWTAGSQTLSGAQADAITNYADLFLRFVSNQV